MNEKFSSEEIFKRDPGLLQQDMKRASEAGYPRVTLDDGKSYFVDAAGLIEIPRRYGLQLKAPQIDTIILQRLLETFPKVNRFSVLSGEVADLAFRLYGLSIEFCDGAVTIAAAQAGIRQVNARDQGMTLLGIDRRAFTMMRRLIVKNGIEIKSKVVPT